MFRQPQKTLLRVPSLASPTFRSFASKGIRKKRMGKGTDRSLSLSEILLLTSVGLGGFVAFDLIFDTNLGVKRFSHQLGLTELLQPVTDAIHDLLGSISAPVEDEILMSWPDFCRMAGAPEEMFDQVPPTLVVGMEDVVLGVKHDRQHGYLFAWRPGAEEMLTELSSIYEVVIFATGAMDPQVGATFMGQADPSNPKKPLAYHVKDSNYLKYHEGKLIKDMNLLGRPLNQVVVLESARSKHLCVRNMENCIFVDPYMDVENHADIQMLELTPLLRELGLKMRKGGIRDVRRVLNKLGGEEHAARDMIEKYENMKEEVSEKKQSGWGSRLRKSTPSFSGSDGGSQGLTSKDIVSSSVRESQSEETQLKKKKKSKGSLWSYIDRKNEEKAEESQRKNEIMQQKYLEKQKEKKTQES